MHQGKKEVYKNMLNGFLFPVVPVCVTFPLGSTLLLLRRVNFYTPTFSSSLWFKKVVKQETVHLFKKNNLKLSIKKQIRKRTSTVPLYSIYTVTDTGLDCPSFGCSDQAGR